MAYVWDCPECGKGNIPVTSMSCPVCGTVRTKRDKVRTAGEAIFSEESWKDFFQTAGKIKAPKMRGSWRNGKYAAKTLAGLRNHKDVVCLDTETTGLSHDSQIIQFSAIRISLPEFEEVSRINLYIRPDKPLPPVITEVTGLTDRFFEPYPEEKEVFQKIKEFLGEDPFVCGYNVFFDIERIRDLYARNHDEFSYEDALDVMEMAKDLVPPEKLMVKDGGKLDDGFPHYKQELVAPLVHADAGIHFHSAIDDTTVVVRLLRIFKTMYEDRKDTQAENPPAKASLIRSYWWINPRKKSQARVRVITSLGECYYDPRLHMWREPSNKESKGFFAYVDMEDLEQKVLSRWYASSMDEVVKLSRKNYQRLKKAM